MKVRLLIGAAAMLAIAGACTASAHAEELERDAQPRGCVVYEDDSYTCGVLAYSTVENQIVIDYAQPSTSGCIPGGYCEPEPEPDAD